jgi:hypothetical protein
LAMEAWNRKGPLSNDRKCRAAAAVRSGGDGFELTVEVAMSTQEKTIAEATVRAEFGYVSPDELRFDPNNPRFGGELLRKRQEQIQELLIGKPYYASELIDSFLENGFIGYEPLVVRKEDGLYVVLEGNRRLAAVKHILQNRSEYETAENKEKINSLEEIPVLKFPDIGASQDAAQRIYLGVRHLFGYREWPPLSKAKFLHREIKELGDIDRVVRELGITKSDIQRYLTPYRVLLKTESDIPEGKDFWLLGESLTRSGVRKYVQLDVNRKTVQVNHVNTKKVSHLLDFVYGKYNKSKRTRDPSTARISDTRQLKDLARALGSDDASAALELGHDLQLALMLVETREESIKRLKRLLRELTALFKDGLRLRARVQAEKDVLDTFKDFEEAAKSYLENVDTDI